MRESKLEKECCAMLRQLGCLAIKFNSMSSRGWPDRIVLPPYERGFYIEFKRKGEKLDKLQAIRHQELASRGHAVYVCDSFEAFDEILKAENLMLEVEKP